MSLSIENLVFEGGGVKGAAYAGALRELHNEGVLKGIKRVAGTSAGAITATLLAIGCTIEEIDKILRETNMKSFMDDKAGVIRDIWNLFKCFGWYRGNVFEEWMKKILKEKTGNKDITFKELCERDGSGPKDLYLIVTNLTTGRAEVCSCNETPDMEVWKAVRMSMSIPIFFEAVKHMGHIYVDGGVSWNYPIDLFDRIEFVPVSLREEENPNRRIRNWMTLGFRVDTQQEIFESKGLMVRHQKIKGIKSFTGALIGFMTEAANRCHMTDSDIDRTVFIDSVGIKATDFDLDKEKIQLLVESGQKHTRSHLEWRKQKSSSEN